MKLVTFLANEVFKEKRSQLRAKTNSHNSRYIVLVYKSAENNPLSFNFLVTFVFLRCWDSISSICTFSRRMVLLDCSFRGNTSLVLHTISLTTLYGFESFYYIVSWHRRASIWKQRTTNRPLISTFMYLEFYLVLVEFLILEGDNLHKLFPNVNFNITGPIISGKQGFVILTALFLVPTTWLRTKEFISARLCFCLWCFCFYM